MGAKDGWSPGNSSYSSYSSGQKDKNVTKKTGLRNARKSTACLSLSLVLLDADIRGLVGGGFLRWYPSSGNR